METLNNGQLLSSAVSLIRPFMEMKCSCSNEIFTEKQSPDCYIISENVGTRAAQSLLRFLPNQRGTLNCSYQICRRTWKIVLAGSLREAQLVQPQQKNTRVSLFQTRPSNMALMGSCCPWCCPWLFNLRMNLGPFPYEAATLSLKYHTIFPTWGRNEEVAGRRPQPHMRCPISSYMATGK